MGDLTTFETIIIAIVEGLTEFLPVSSTGHMIIAQKRIGRRKYGICKGVHGYHSVWCDSFGSLPLLETFLPVEPCTGAGGIHLPSSAFCTNLISIGSYWSLSSPAAVLGFLFSDKIDEMLESVVIVAVMLVIGGIFMLFCDKIFSQRKGRYGIDGKKSVQHRFVSVHSHDTGGILPMATIVGGMAQKLTRKGCRRIFVLPGSTDHVCGNRI